MQSGWQIEFVKNNLSFKEPLLTHLDASDHDCLSLSEANPSSYFNASNYANAANYANATNQNWEIVSADCTSANAICDVHIVAKNFSVKVCFVS